MYRSFRAQKLKLENLTAFKNDYELSKFFGMYYLLNHKFETVTAEFNFGKALCLNCWYTRGADSSRQF